MSFVHLIADFGHPNIQIFVYNALMQWDEKELDTQFTPDVYFHLILKSWLKSVVLCIEERQELSHYQKCYHFLRKKI